MFSKLSSITHQADPSDPGLGHGTLAHLGGFLPEEEVKLIVVLLAAVGDEVSVDERGVWAEEEEMVRVLVSERIWFDLLQ